MVEEIKTIEEFKEALTGENDLVIIDFFTNWCRPCKLIGPEIEKLSEKYSTIGFHKINTENKALKEICEICEITSIPSFCYFLKGSYITKVVGANITKIEEKIKQYDTSDEKIRQHNTSDELFRQSQPK